MTSPLHSLRVLTATALAAQLGMSRRWVYGQVEEHGLPAIKLGRTLLFDPAAVEAWLCSHRIGDWPESCGDMSSAAGISAVEELRG